MLNVEQVDVHYGDIQALWNVSFKVGAGKIVSLIGSNGAGKTTVLKTVAGILKPTKGTVTIEGIRSDQIKAHRIVDLGVSLVPEGRRLFRDMTVFENLELGGYIGRARPMKNEQVAWLFEMFPVIRERVKHLAGTLSGGEQQMLAIARGLMSHPKLLLVDELSLGLAPLVVKSIYKSLEKVNRTKNMTILVVEQNVRLALEISHTGYIIENGRITGEGAAGELLNSDRVKTAYLAMG